MAKPRNRLLDYLAYLVVRLATFLDYVLPWSIRHCMTRLVAYLIFRIDRRHRNRAMGHLRRSFPDWSEEACRHVAWQSFLSMSYMAMEILLAPRLVRADTWGRYIRLRDMGEAVRLMVQRKTGVIILTGHFGNWELAGYLTGATGLPTVTIGRRLGNPYLQKYILHLRQKAGQRMLDKEGASRLAGPVLENRGVLTIACDQDAGRKGLFVDFFGRPASTYKSIGLLAMQYRTPLCVIYCRRLRGTYRFEVGAQRIIHPQEWDGKDDPLRWITQEYTTAMEQVVRGEPQQYLWAHRRWKHRPGGKEDPPDGIA